MSKALCPSQAWTRPLGVYSGPLFLPSSTALYSLLPLGLRWTFSVTPVIHSLTEQYFRNTGPVLVRSRPWGTAANKTGDSLPSRGLCSN